MAIKKYKPITPGQRGMTVSAFDEITKTTPEKTDYSWRKSAAAPSHLSADGIDP